MGNIQWCPYLNQEYPYHAKNKKVREYKKASKSNKIFQSVTYDIINKRN